jgi:hypothetical protein
MNQPTVTGQCAEVLSLIRKLQPVLSLTLTADYAIPETASRVHDLRNIGFNVITTIRDEVIFRGHVRRRVASYSLGSPEWPAPGYLSKEPPLTGQMNLGGV